MSLTHSPPALAALGWNPHCARELAALNLQDAALAAARIVEQHRSRCVVHDGVDAFDAVAHPSLQQGLAQQDDGLSVGDWVVVDRGSNPPRIVHYLPRTSLLARGQPDGSRQRLVANVDCALMLMGLDGDYSPGRLERYWLMVRAAGVTPVVLLSKADRCDQVEARVAEIQALAGPTVPVQVIDPRRDETADLLAPYCRPGTTLVLLGSSGVGKSTLMNTLFGQQVQKTQATRESDDTGRHTTVVRTLRMLPGGACLIDAPGLRELRLLGEESVDRHGFAEVAELASQCRFSDCAHQREPGCAVVAALSPERLAGYHKLQGELAEAARVARQLAERKQRDKRR